MTELQKTRQGYDDVAERYAAEVGEELQHKPLDRALLNALVELAGGGVIADLGCGPGHVTSYLAGCGADAIGMDLSPGMCVTAVRRTPAGTKPRPFCAADLAALPLRSGSLAGLISFYALIHLDESQRHRAYREFVRVLRPGGLALIAFHTSDADTATGTARTMTDWWGHAIDITFRFLDPAVESAALAAAGLEQTGRLDRAPHPGLEHASQRCYLLARAGGK